MHRLAILFAAILAGLLNCGFAYAADLPLAPAYQAPIVVPVPVYTWTGLYLGINGGYAFGTTNWTSPAGCGFPTCTTGNFNASGFLIGGTLGGNYQIGSFVIGLEGDGDWTDINGETQSS